MIRSTKLKKKKQKKVKKPSHISFYNRSTRASCSKEVSRESRFDSLTDSWFPLDDIFNQGNENLREVLGRLYRD